LDKEGLFDRLAVERSTRQIERAGATRNPKNLVGGRRQQEYRSTTKKKRKIRLTIFFDYW